MASNIDYGNAISRPFQDIKKLVIGCLLNILPIVNFLSMGFVVESAKITLKKKDNLPEWDNWGDLFMNGLMVFVIGLIWAIPAIILATIGFGSMWTSIMSGTMMGSTPSLVGLGGFGISVLLALIVGLVTAFFVPIAIFGYVTTGQFKDAFDFNTIFKKALNLDYFIVWLVTAVIGIVLSAIGGAIPFVSYILSPAASFISMMIGVTLIGSIYKSL